MGTVDKKGFLTEKVTTGGIVNFDRAVVAAEMTNTMPVTEAIARAKSDVSPEVVVPLPLYPMFQ
jgi:hypothetical protein